MSKIAIFSLENDLHAHVILHELNKRPGVEAHFIPTDAMTSSSSLTWRGGKQSRSALKSSKGQTFDLNEIDVVWWRRVNQPQKAMADEPDEVTQDFVNNEWKAAVFGLVFDRFRGTWVNLPPQDALAGNKLYQLTHAAECGFKIPDTLISQDPDEVRRFCSAHGGEVIAKKIVGAYLVPLATIAVSEEQLSDSTAIQMCPAIYQERIQGNTHLRVNCFGGRVIAVAIDSYLLDWRRDYSVPFRPFQLDDSVEQQVRSLTKKLGLAMAIMDMMITETGEVVWIELNTQGQFLFGEALAKVDLKGEFADFLIEQCA